MKFEPKTFMIFFSPILRTLAAIAAVLAAFATAGFAQSDEIQVYNAGLAGKGVFNLTWHNNFTPLGVKAPAFPGGLSNDKTLNGVTEWAYGVTDWFEAGLYLPLYSITKDRGPSINGGKVRLLFAVPHADDRIFFYGANFEFSITRNTGTSGGILPIRPIIGWHLKPVDIIFNPILDNSWRGGIKNLEFAPATRVAYNINPTWTVALAEYADIGTLRQVNPIGQQSHQLFGVVNRNTKFAEFEFGIGFGLTGASDKVTLKLLISRDLNGKK